MIKINSIKRETEIRKNIEELLRIKNRKHNNNKAVDLMITMFLKTEIIASE